MNGIIVVNKGKDVTSRDVVNDLVHIFNTREIGHTGTLDPMATGVLVCTLGKYTKLNLALTSTYKEYIAEAKLGITTDTLDITGNILEECDFNLTNDEIVDTVLGYKKKYLQEVPIYSSVKVNGRKLYEYARNHEEVELPRKEVDIKEIEILDTSDNIIKFRCVVSKGCYIRSLIRDIGVSLGCGATMLSLIRTKQGNFDIEASFTIDEIKNNNYHILDIEDVLDLEEVLCDDVLYKKINNGVKLDNIYKHEYVLFNYHNERICLYHREDDKYVMYLKY